MKNYRELGGQWEDLSLEEKITKFPQYLWADLRSLYGNESRAKQAIAHAKLVGKRGTYAIKLPPPKGKAEKGVDIAAGLSAFITKLWLLKKVGIGTGIIPKGSITGDMAVWETLGLTEQDIPGQMAAIRGGLGLIGKIPLGSITGKVAKTALESGLFAGTTAVLGGKTEDIIISGLVPVVFNTWNFAKQKQYIKNYEKGLKRAAYTQAQRIIAKGNKQAWQVYQQNLKSEMNPAEAKYKYQKSLRHITSLANNKLAKDARWIKDTVTKAKQKIYRDDAFAPTREKWDAQRQKALKMIASDKSNQQRIGRDILAFMEKSHLGELGAIPPEGVKLPSRTQEVIKAVKGIAGIGEQTIQEIRGVKGAPKVKIPKPPPIAAPAGAPVSITPAEGIKVPPKAAEAVTEGKPAEKAPLSYQMTRTGYENKIRRLMLEEAETRGESETYLKLQWALRNSKQGHKNLVENALKAGEKIPKEVLEEYKSEKWAQDALAKPAPAAEKPKLVDLGPAKEVKKKVYYTSVPEEWRQHKELSDWGKKGIRTKGNLKIGKRKTFIWTSEFSGMPTRLPKATMDAFRAKTDEIWYVTNRRKGVENYYLIPKQVVATVRKELGDKAFVRKPKSVPTPRQVLTYAIQSANVKGEIHPGSVIEIALADKDIGITEAKLTANQKKILAEFRSPEYEHERNAVLQDIQAGIEEKVRAAGEEVEERIAIQEEDTAAEVGDFLDGIVKEAEELPLESLSDAELKARRNDLPKYKNDMNLVQRSIADAIYLEQLRRYKGKVAEYNKKATEATGLKHGDKVSRFQTAAFGTGGEEYTGKVIYDKNGRLAIRTDRPDGTGRKTFPINKGWEKIKERPTDLIGRPILAGGVAGKQAEFLEKEKYRLPEPDIEGQMKFPLKEKPRKPSRPLKELGGIPEKPPGLTRAEVEYLGKRERRALRAGQKRGLPIGYKMGARWEIDKARSKMNQIRMAKLFEEQNRKEAVEIVQNYVPKEKQGSYIRRILVAKTPQRVEKLTEAIDSYLDRAEKRQTVREFRTFVKGVRSKYRRGETELGKLRSDVRSKVLETIGKYDTAKLSEAKRNTLESRDQYVKDVAGSISDAFGSLEEKGKDILQMPNARIEELNRLSKAHIGTLDADQIRYIQSSLEHLIAIAERKGQIKERIRAEKVRDLVNKSIKEVDIKKDYGTIREKQGMFGFIKSLLTTSQATPRTLVGFMTGKDNPATQELITKNLYEGLSKKLAKAKELILASRKEFKNAGLSKKDFNLLDKKVKITLGGKTFNATYDNVLSIYMHIQADGNLRRLLKTKGLDIANYFRDPKTGYTIKTKTVNMTRRPRLEEAREIKRLVEDNPKLKAMADKYFDINYKYQRLAVNETSMQYQNFEIAKDRKHWPVHRVGVRGVEGQATNISVSIEQQGRYLPRTGGNQRIRIVPWRQEVINGLQSDATYYGTTMPMRDIKALVGNQAWQIRMTKTGKGREMKTLIKLLRRIQGQSTDQSFIEMAGSKVLNGFGKSVLSLRLSGYGVQTASVPAAFEVIEPKYFTGLRAASRLPVIPIKTIREMMDLSPKLWMRWTARQFDFVTGGAAAQHAFDNLMFDTSTLTEKGLKHYTAGDQKALYHIYIAAQNKIAAETDLKRGTTEFKKKAIKLVEQAAETQPQWDIPYRNELTSSPNVFLRGSTMFMSARSAQYNVLLRAMDDYRKGRIGAGEFGKRTSGVIMANILVAVVKKLIRLGVKLGALGLIYTLATEEEEKKVKKIAKVSAVKAAKQIPIDSALNMVSLPAFGSIAQNVAYEVIRKLKYRYIPTDLKNIRTGNIFTDLALDVTGTSVNLANMSKYMLTGEKFKSGPDKGKPKWQRETKKAADGIAELIAIRYGLPYSAAKGEVYYQIKSAQRAAEESAQRAAEEPGQTGKRKARMEREKRMLRK